MTSPGMEEVEAMVREMQVGIEVKAGRCVGSKKLVPRK